MLGGNTKFPNHGVRGVPQDRVLYACHSTLVFCVRYHGYRIKVYVVHNRGVNHSVRGVVYTSRAVVAELSELRVLSLKVIG